MTDANATCQFCGRPLVLFNGRSCASCGREVAPAGASAGDRDQVVGTPAPGDAPGTVSDPTAPPAAQIPVGQGVQPPAQMAPGQWAQPGAPPPPGQWAQPGAPPPPGQWAPGYYQAEKGSNQAAIIIGIVVALFVILFVIPILALIALSGQIHDILSQVGNGI